MKSVKVKAGRFHAVGDMVILVFESCSCRANELHYPIDRPSSCPHCDTRLPGTKLYGISPEERIRYHLEP